MIQLCTDRNSIQIHVHVREVLRSTQNPPPPRLVVSNVLYEFCLAKLQLITRLIAKQSSFAGVKSDECASARGMQTGSRMAGASVAYQPGNHHRDKHPSVRPSGIRGDRRVDPSVSYRSTFRTAARAVARRSGRKMGENQTPGFYAGAGGSLHPRGAVEVCPAAVRSSGGASCSIRRWRRRRRRWLLSVDIGYLLWTPSE